MLKFTPILFALTLAPCVSHAADNCEALRVRIEANIAAKGITGFTVTTVDATATLPGQVVGSCDQGAKKIVYARGGGAPAARPVAQTAQAPAQPAAPKPRAVRKSIRDEDILTECKDGTVSMGGSCKN
jgi:hypothetical protein